MHPAARDFVANAAAAIPADGRAVEFGALDVNGTGRHSFPRYTWTGIDLRAGPNVDLVIAAADFDETGYDLVLCTETLEHAPDPGAIIAAAYRALKPGGYLILTAAAPERAPHNCQGDPLQPGSEHYAGIDAADLTGWLNAAGFPRPEVRHSAADGDVYVLARKSIDGKAGA